jgi:hypothetical protein
LAEEWLPARGGFTHFVNRNIYELIILVTKIVGLIIKFTLKVSRQSLPKRKRSGGEQIQEQATIRQRLERSPEIPAAQENQGSPRVYHYHGNLAIIED